MQERARGREREQEKERETERERKREQESECESERGVGCTGEIIPCCWAMNHLKTVRKLLNSE